MCEDGSMDLPLERPPGSALTYLELASKLALGTSRCEKKNARIAILPLSTKRLFSGLLYGNNAFHLEYLCTLSLASVDPSHVLVMSAVCDKSHGVQSSFRDSFQ